MTFIQLLRSINKISIVLSKHLNEEHAIIDLYQQQIDLWSRLEQKMQTSEYAKSKDGYHCKRPDCTYTTHFWMGLKNDDGMVQHAEWHRRLDLLNIPYLSRTEDHPICIFPCPEEPCRYGTPFSHSRAYIDHKSKHHPDFIFKCRICNYNATSSAKLYNHISSRHKRGRFEIPNSLYII